MGQPWASAVSCGMQSQSDLVKSINALRESRLADGTFVDDRLGRLKDEFFDDYCRVFDRIGSEAALKVMLLEVGAAKFFFPFFF